MWDRKWVFVDGDDGDLSELEVTPAGGCWQKLSRLSIRQTVEELWCYQSGVLPITSLEGIEWQYFSNVVVLQLYGLKSICGSLNLKGMTCLRSLQLYDLRCLERLEGLELLKHLTSFDWQIPFSTLDVMMKTHVVGQFPTSLRYLYISRQCMLSGSNVLARCNNLIKLYLYKVEVGAFLDLSNCSSLEGVEICNIKSLQTLSGLTATGSSRLQTLEISFINGIHIPGLDQLNGLVRLYVIECGSSWEVPGLLSLTKLQALSIGAHAKPAEHCIPHQLQELYYRWTQYEAPCLNAFKQLQVLDFTWSRSLTCMCGMGDLPALRSLNLTGCYSLKWLPDLSKSKSLEELNLDGCYGLQLWEEDFEMLATLPLLHPVCFAHESEQNRIRLDIVGWKFLRHLQSSHDGLASWLAWKKGEWEELELGLFPIELANRGIWDNYVFVEYRDLQEYRDLEEYQELDDIEFDMKGLEDFELELEDMELEWKIFERPRTSNR